MNPLSPSVAKPARIAAVQWQFVAHNLSAFLAKVEGFVTQAASYRCDAVVFPEFFSLGLLESPMASVESIRHLAAHSTAIIEHCRTLAQQHQINILAGSLPVLHNEKSHDGQLRNVATFCHRDGKIIEQPKLHPTPYEQGEWSMHGGNTLTAFDTDFGRCGILVCYDAEFPELARLLRDQQMDILLIPFWTDSLNAYHRVRYCAQARAIENECYVVIAGGCGTIAGHEVIDSQHAQSAVFTPSDYPFPEHAVLAEARANEEMMIVAELDLNMLTTLRESGSVQIGKNRRHDLYSINWKGK